MGGADATQQPEWMLAPRSHTETMHLIRWHFVLLRKHCGWIWLVLFFVSISFTASSLHKAGWKLSSVSIFFSPKMLPREHWLGPKSYQVGLILSTDTCDNYFIKAVEAVHTPGTPVALTEGWKTHVVCVSPSATHCFYAFFFNTLCITTSTLSGSFICLQLLPLPRVIMWDLTRGNAEIPSLGTVILITTADMLHYFHISS